MKLFKKILKVLSVLLLLLLLSGGLYLYASGPTLAEGTDEIIEKVLANPVPEVVTGERGFAKSQALDIWYESIAPPDSIKGTILFIMGISSDGLSWPPSFIQSFVAAGYQVIRYDHRGTGMSDWVADWDPKNPYSLTDMAMDGIAILDALGVDKAHILGVSMGGMIAQELAIKYPERTLSLCSIMSSADVFDPELPPISSSVAFDLVKVALKYGIIGGEKNMIKLHLASQLIIMGEAVHPLQTQEIAERVLYNLRNRKGYNLKVSRQHQAAIWAADARYDALQNIAIPTVIIHGVLDPFIPIEHGKKCAAVIPEVDTLWLEDMGHDIPELLIGKMSDKIINNFSRKLN